VSDFFQSLIDRSLDGIMAFDTRLVYTVWNHAMEEIAGVPAEKVIGKSAVEVFPHIQKTGVLVLYERVLKGETISIVNQEFTYLTTKERGYYDGNWVPIRDEEKKIVGGYAVISDVTKRNRAVAEQKQFFDQSLDVICVAGLDGYYKRVNPAFVNLIGYSLEELLKIPFLELIHPDDRAAAEEEMKKLKRGEPIERFECRLVCKDGSYHWLEWRTSVVGETIYASGRDLSEKKKMEKEVAEQRAALVFSSKMVALGEMAAGIAHEINTPLAVIGMNAGHARSMIEADITNPAALLRAVEKIESTVERIAGVVKGLRFFARDGSKDRFENVSAKIVLEGAMGLCREFLKNKGIVILEGEIPESAVIRCRSVQMSQVILNLLNNSSDAIEGQAEPWVKIEVLEQEDSVLISITDSGPGIDLELRSKIMQPFFTTKEVGRGTGLGLSVARGIIQEHGGELRLDTECPNTRFVIELPKERASN
jgi:PAS domain S-box-containing protein